MRLLKKIFGINPDERTDPPNGLRGTGVEGGKGIFDEYFNQILFETQADHIVDTEANVKLADDPRGTCYYNSTATEFQDRNDATVTFADGDAVAWRGLDTLTASIDISTIDDLTHIMFQGVTLALSTFDLDLGENQRGDLNISGTGTLTILSSGGLSIINSGVTIDNQDGNVAIDRVITATNLDSDAITSDEIIATKIRVGSASAPVIDLDVSGSIRASVGVLFGTDTAAVNTLDDYEEGSWSPSFIAYTGDPNSTANTFYVKIGKFVIITADIDIGVNTDTSVLTIGSLPFASGGSNTDIYGGHLTFNTAAQNFILGISESDTRISGRRPGPVTMKYDDLSGESFSFMCYYFVS